MDREKIKKLKWLMDFMRIDLTRAPLGEIAKLEAELRELLFFWGLSRYKNTDFSSDRIIGSAKERQVPDQIEILLLKKTQSALKEFFQHMMKQVERATSDEYQKWTSEENFFKAGLIAPAGAGFSFSLVHEMFAISIGALVAGKLPDSALFEYAEGENGEKLYRINREHLLNSPIQLYHRENIFKKGIIYEFLTSLEGVSLNSFHRCPECNEWFFHAAKREKIYCSNLCAARAGTRKNRQIKKEEDPEGYENELKDNAERARKSYERKVRFGKPDRRPYKYTDDKE